MRKISIYEYTDYKHFISDWFENTPHQGRGLRIKLAQAIGCQGPYITHVLNGNYHFNLEQAEASCRWMGLEEKETEFFMLLVMFQRASTKSLQNLFRRQISERRTSQSTLKTRLNIKSQMPIESQIKYYSQWYFAAIHMACLIPELQTIEALQRYFILSMQQIKSVLEFLVKNGFLEETRSKFRVLKPILHLERSSPLAHSHHTAWRLKGLDCMAKSRHTDLFYSGVISLSKDDFEWLREKLSHLVEEMIGRIKDSKDEALVCMNLDLFEILDH